MGGRRGRGDFRVRGEWVWPLEGFWGGGVSVKSGSMQKFLDVRNMTK